MEEFARLTIDAGADAVFGHGAHMFRGVEIYKKRPIFYNLGSLLIEFEAGESIIPPEMYQAYGYKTDALPSDLHGNRAKDSEGHFIGFNSSPIFSWNLVADIRLDKEISFKLLPIHNQLQSEKVTKRGIPRLVSDEEGRQIVKRLNQVSEAYQTKFEFEDGWIRLKK